jgi:hypothetical protein
MEKAAEPKEPKAAKEKLQRLVRYKERNESHVYSQ